VKPPLPPQEIDEVVDASADDFLALRGARILLTGGTGFIGDWLTSCLLRADDRLRLGLRIALLTRRPHCLPARVADHCAVDVVVGDVRQLPPVGTPDLVIHAAASSSAKYGVGDGEPRTIASTIVQGTESVLTAARGARLLFFSSGAVYGRTPEPVAEDHSGAPDSMEPATAYAQAKRLAETLCAAATAAGDASVIVARLFAFVGPGLPLDAHFAAGNLIGDVLAGRPLVVTGDGRAVRSYLYAADLVSWAMALLVRGVAGRAYNVGSPDRVTIRELAGIAAGLAGTATPLPVRVLQRATPGVAPHVYVPSVDRAINELGVKVSTTLPVALARTVAWHRDNVSAAATSAAGLAGFR